MSIWDYWNATPADKANLRLLISGKGWTAFSDRLDDEGKVVERGSKEQIDSALINALSASNFLTLTGAGASLCARNGAGEPHAPSMVDLWDAVSAAVGPVAFAAICAKFPKAKIDDNIEKLLSLCKVYLELNEAAQADDADVNAVRTFVTQAEACILSKVDFVSQTTALPAHEAYVRKIGRRGFRKARAKIFTTNYDLTLEEAARRLRFTIIDGFSHSLDQVYDPQHFDFDIVRRDANKDAPDYIPNVFHLYKLHGSTDWRRIGTDVFRSRDNDKGKPVLIYPRSSKYQEAFDPPYLDMMGAFQAALREPDTSLGAEILAQMIGRSTTRQGEKNVPVGAIEAGGRSVQVDLSPEKLFGRHCGVFGATGGGKSWTIASLVEKIKAMNGKAIVFDPTGEFCGIDGIDTIFAFEAGVPNARHVHFPYTEITEDDLFSLFRPSGQSQGPKLRDAIKSLKLVRAVGNAIPQGLAVANGALEKAGKSRTVFFDAIRNNAQAVHSAKCNFDIAHLSEQIKNECVWGTANGNATQFGGPDNNAASYCESLASRINTLTNSRELECIFRTQGDSLVDELSNFLNDDERDIALISFKEVRFEHNTRELLLNIIGRFLLNIAREGRFRDAPIVVFLDEAHQFLGRTVGDEYGSVRLDSFGLIAKEGRKYGLTCVLATQRPRDVPQDVLSQLGTLIVHRLTNEQDRGTVEHACGDLDRAATQFIPMLAPGEAIIIGPDLPTPLPLRMLRPKSPPDSKGPPFQAYWADRQERWVERVLGIAPAAAPDADL